MNGGRGGRSTKARSWSPTPSTRKATSSSRSPSSGGVPRRQTRVSGGRSGHRTRHRPPHCKDGGDRDPLRSRAGPHRCDEPPCDPALIRAVVTDTPRCGRVPRVPVPGGKPGEIFADIHITVEAALPVPPCPRDLRRGGAAAQRGGAGGARGGRGPYRTRRLIVRAARVRGPSGTPLPSPPAA